MSRVAGVLLGAVILAAFPLPARALDPPHDWTNTIDCSACHTPHKAPGGALTNVKGNANLCQSCHVTGGLAGNKALAEADQALPWPGLPSGTAPTGTSHRWDSGPAGHVRADGTNTSTGTVQSAGAFTGRYAKSYTITITSAGDAGIAVFSWTDTLGGGASGLFTGADVTLDQGVTATFTDGSGSPSFKLNDGWRIYVRTDLNQPSAAALALRIADGKIMCSTCHNQHSQAAEPFDPAAPGYAGSGTGAGRHFQRVANDTNQMCVDCHSARNVTQSSQGSHPVGVSIPGSGFFKSPSTLPLDKTTGQVRCLTCHQPHFAPTADGTLRRVANVTALCTDCHTLADTATPAAHLNTTTGALWPGGFYGSTFPPVDTSKRGYCTNCHQPHGWPDTLNTAQNYPSLLVERVDVSSNPTNPGNICYTCHDADGPAGKKVKDDFAKTVHHPVKDSEQVTGRDVYCTDCHNPHTALVGAHTYSTTADANRNQVSGPIVGASGVSVSYTGLGNFVAPAAGNYTAGGAATYEYQVCFKCHTGYSFGATPPAGLTTISLTNYTTGTATFTSGGATVTGSGTTWTSAMVGGQITRRGDTSAYQITAFTSATSLTISPAYGGTTASGQNYTIAYPGTATFTNGNPTVAGVGTAWAAGMVGSWIRRGSEPTLYRITAVASATSLTISPAYAGTTGSTAAYAISLQTDLAQEFSPNNRSGHPVVTGLDNYPNSTAVGTTPKKGLQAAALLAPWNVNIGQQTMMCVDCHNTDAASPAAQGPHGSAVQFMLRGANAANWPNVTLANFATSWCANCHANSAGPPHTEGNHSSRQCYNCHIVIPHGGKMSRLIGDRETMPARYAYNNTLTNMQIQSFTKRATGSTGGYTTSSCQAACTGTHSGAATENW